MRSKSTVFYSSVIGISFCSAPLCSVGLGLAGAFELAARTLSASLRPRPGRAERKRTDPDKPSLPGDASQGGAADACCTPSPLGLAGALDLAARARSASLGRSTGQSLTKANRTRQASGQAYSETLRWAGPRMLVALNTETSILRALNARVRTSIYIYIYIYISPISQWITLSNYLLPGYFLEHLSWHFLTSHCGTRFPHKRTSSGNFCIH